MHPPTPKVLIAANWKMHLTPPEAGASLFTGESFPLMLKAFGVTHVSRGLHTAPL